jgi:hypothetical protein
MPQKTDGGALIYSGKQTQKIGNFQLLTPENCAQFYTAQDLFGEVLAHESGQK